MEFNNKRKAVVFGMVLVLLITSLTLISDGGIFQAQFDVSGGNEAEIYISGVRYSGEEWLSEEDFPYGYDEWSSNKICFDPDGPIDENDQEPLVNLLFPHYEFEDIEGMKPDICMEIETTPKLVDLDGNNLDGGYTLLEEDSQGRDVYIYHYNFDFSLSVSADEFSSKYMKNVGFDLQPVIDPKYFPFVMDGSLLATDGFAEIGVIRNPVYCLFGTNLPNLEGYNLGWSLKIDSVGIEVILDGEDISSESNYFKDNFLEDTSPPPGQWNYNFYINIATGIGPSHSGNSRASHTTVNGMKMAGLGIDKASCWGAYQSSYESYLSDFNSEWHLVDAAVNYNLRLVISATDVSEDSDGDDGDNGDTTTTTTTTDDEDDDWDPEDAFDFWKGLSEEEKGYVIVGAIISFGILIVAFGKSGGGPRYGRY